MKTPEQPYPNPPVSVRFVAGPMHGQDITVPLDCHLYFERTSGIVYKRCGCHVQGEKDMRYLFIAGELTPEVRIKLIEDALKPST